MNDRRTIVFFPEGAFGPTNNCVGIGNVLRARGHRVVFIVEESFAGRLEAQGFEERLMRLGPPPEVPEIPGQFWIDFIRDTAPVFRKPTVEQLGEFIAPTWQALCDGARYVEPRLQEIFGELAAGRDRRGQRRRLRGGRDGGPAVGPDRELQSGRGQGPGHPAVLERLSDVGPEPTGRRSSRRSAGRTASCGRPSTRSCASTAPRASPTGRSVPSSSTSRRS